jgi:Protein of unknown function (DUF1688)
LNKATSAAEAFAAAAASEPSRHPLALLHHPGTVRARCAAVLASVESGVSAHFTLDRDALVAVADRVATLTRQRYPSGVIPFHSRWRHFEAGGVDRKAQMDAALAGASVADVARARFDLTVVSVLLDAGALPQAAPDDLLAMLDAAAAPSPAPSPAATPAAAPAAEPTPQGAFYTRSEGLGVASFRAFMAGAFSAKPGEPARADAAALRHVDAAALRAVFQGSSSNAIVGLEGRAQLLSRLGTALQAEAKRTGDDARPGLLFDRLTAGGARTTVAAADVLGEVLRCFSPIWPSGSRVQGLPAGDVWQHRWAGAAVAGGEQTTDRTTEGWVPFHKLSQWMTYSLVEPLQWAGVQVTGLDELTGLPEYRNGGLLLDGGVIKPRRASQLARSYKVGDEFVVEWRALTVVLLDELAVLVRQRLGKTAQELPLACILEGGTWAAGREIAQELRTGGAPPLKIDSDGTVF